MQRAKGLALASLNYTTMSVIEVPFGHILALGELNEAWDTFRDTLSFVPLDPFSSHFSGSMIQWIIRVTMYHAHYIVLLLLFVFTFF